MIEQKTDTPVIYTDQVVRRFGEGAALVTAVGGVSLTVESGEFAALVGPSGSGKSTLLNLIGGLDEPDEGHIALAGMTLTSMSSAEMSNFRRDHIGFISSPITSSLCYRLQKILNTSCCFRDLRLETEEREWMRC